MTISVRLSPEDTKLVQDFAKFKNISISELVRQAVIERIEDEIDLRAYKKAMAEYKANPVTYTHDEIVKILRDED